MSDKKNDVERPYIVDGIKSMTTPFPPGGSSSFGLPLSMASAICFTSMFWRANP